MILVGHSVFLQIVWAFVAWVGVAVSILALAEATRNRGHAQRAGGPAMRRRVQIANIAIRNEYVRMFSQAAFLGLAMIVPMAPSPEPASLCCVVTGYVLMIVSAVMTVNAVMAWHNRQTLIREAMAGGD